MTNRMCVSTLSLALLVGLVGFAPAQDDDTVTIQWKLKKGQELNYDLVQNLVGQPGELEGFDPDRYIYRLDSR